MYMKNNNNLELNIDDFDISLLKEYKNFVKKEVADPRQPWKVEYKLWDIIVTATIAILCNNDELVDIHDFIKSKREFFKQFLKLTNGIASKDTYARVLSLIDPVVLQDCLNHFIQTIVYKTTLEKEIISLDVNYHAINCMACLSAGSTLLRVNSLYYLKILLILILLIFYILFNYLICYYSYTSTKITTCP